MTKPAGDRPDPRVAASWCREGVSHDHAACGLLWNSADPAHVEAAASWADQLAAQRKLLLCAAANLRSELLCNWDRRVATALADWLEGDARVWPCDPKAIATARALLASWGMDED